MYYWREIKPPSKTETVSWIKNRAAPIKAQASMPGQVFVHEKIACLHSEAIFNTQSDTLLRCHSQKNIKEKPLPSYLNMKNWGRHTEDHRLQLQYQLQQAGLPLDLIDEDILLSPFPPEHISDSDSDELFKSESSESDVIMEGIDPDNSDSSSDSSSTTFLLFNIPFRWLWRVFVWWEYFW